MKSPKDRPDARWPISQVTLASWTLGGFTMLGVAVSSLSFTVLDERAVIGLAAIFVSGLSFGNAVGAFRVSRLVRREKQPAAG